MQRLIVRAGIAMLICAAIPTAGLGAETAVRQTPSLQQFAPVAEPAQLDMRDSLNITGINGSAQWIGVRGAADSLDVLFTETLPSVLADPARFDELQKWFFQRHPRARRISFFFLNDDRQVVSAAAWLQEHEPRLPPDQWGAPQYGFADRAVEPGTVPPPDIPFTGSLTGKVVITSPGHGWLYEDSGWRLQRGSCCGMIEDLSNAEIADWYLIPYLEHAGARVYSVRERDINTNEYIVDNDSGAPAYTETGSWIQSSSTGYLEGGYRYAAIAPRGAPTATASWAADVPAAGRYAVWIFYRAGTNRSTDAHYRIHHSDGMTGMYINQQENNMRWLYLGTYHFAPGHNHRVELLNDSAMTGDYYVITDAVRFGGGVGDVSLGGAASGKPRWQEGCGAWTKYVGAPSAVWSLNDVTCRPGYANWQGGDVYLSLHSNASGAAVCSDTQCTGTARGTSTYIYDGGATPGSADFQAFIQQNIVRDMRTLWDANWVDRGELQANFGELRVLETMPGALVETAFHDADADNVFLQNPKWRHDVARSLYKAVLRFLKDENAVVLPLPLTSLAVTYDGGYDVTVSWTPRPDPLEPTADADGYRVYISTEIQGRGSSVNPYQTPRDNITIPIVDLQPDTVYYVRVAGYNSGGEALISEPVAMRIIPGAAARVLIVNGFDRNDRLIRERDNTHEYVAIHADAMASVQGIGFVSATRAAIDDGLVSMNGYDAVDWYAGEESTADESFSPEEQTMIAAYLNGGGSMFVSGSEIGWDLVEYGSQADTTFYETYFHNTYQNDDAETYKADGTGVFADLNLDFDDGSHGTYDADYPDVIAPAAGAESCAVYGGDAGTAGIYYQGDHNVVYFGFPFETILNPLSRRAVMQKIMGDIFGIEAQQPDGDADVDEDSAPETETVETVDDIVDGDTGEDLDDTADAVTEESDDSDTADVPAEAEAEQDSDTVDAIDTVDVTDNADDAAVNPCEGVDPATLHCEEGYTLINCECVKYDNGSSGSGCTGGATSFGLLAVVLLAMRRKRRG